MKRGSVEALLLHAALAAGAVLTLAPLLWMVSASCMQPGEANAFPPPLWPSAPTVANYTALFTRLDMFRHFLASALIAVAATVASVLVNSLAGYAFAKLPFRGRDRLFGGLAAGLVVPAQVAMLPLFLLLRELHLVNTYAGVLVPYLASIFGIFLVRQYTLGVPDELLDAARVDGAGEFQVFRLVALPVIKPILVTIAAFTFLSAWNDFMWPLIILSDGAKHTLPVALASLVGEHVQDTELMMAGSLLTILPALGVFLVFQRTYVRGIMAGGIKG
ncbi:MAG TPA: carbohydrate ABC transporter permease [Candidatus Krumholzibacteria bacterium]|nr:carbohydrate ABC transporter permease [Candidatus Krumholzibacteria bacterium]HPD70564.1 carbohydrate ABC transporter permease [Candidatus Krumholzibacteria bacterium]HRY39736.1 carbohydrate ABC transporter permease [Candidatus Krumholzibacteria bacterium]